MKIKGILTVSFGTTVNETREKTISALEHAIKENFNECVHETAISSSFIQKILAKRGQNYNNVEQAIEKLFALGVQELYVQPTHLICGEEYDKIVRQAMQHSHKFVTIKIGKPLLSASRDLCTVAEIIASTTPCESNECLILIGHGTEHFANAIYPAMDYVFKQMGYNHVFVGAVEGYPSANMAIDFAKKSGYTKAVFAPMMLVAGDHALNDMSGNDDDSWVNIAKAAGMQVRCCLRGLGEIPQIREVYIEHLKAIVEE